MLLGVACGWILSLSGLPSVTKATIISGLGVPTALFLRLIRMIIAPLVLTTLISGVSQMGGGGVRKIGLLTLLWFVVFSLISVATGLALVNLFGPGNSLHLVPSMARAVGPTAAMGHTPGILDTIVEFAPTSVIDSMAQNRILQIVVFSIFAGVALGSLGERAKAVSEVLAQGSDLMLKMAGYVMAGAPVAVFSALASNVLEHGIGSLAMLGGFVSQFYVALAVMAMWISLAGFLFLGRRIFTLLALMREPLLVAFSTSSSEAAYASSVEAIRKFGVSERIYGFVLPLGYSFNLDGTMVYSAFAVIFIAQAYGIQLPLAEQLGIMLFLMLASKGAAGVPRGALLGLAVALESFRLPQAGLALIIAVDALLDMGRTTINVLGNAVATASIARLEGELSAPSSLSGAK
ncbi:MAG: Sodium:dicarboxylate symporter family protein [Bradyrhizobium sp.]|nr:Sodium:dicarboxylate symporter family protein [Bradyrhizobium sp.]